MNWNRTEVDFYDHTQTVLERFLRSNGGVLCTVIDNNGKDNIITLGWGLIGPHYESHPIVAIAVCPPRYSWQFLEDTGEFVLGIPNDQIREAVDICGSRSGRDIEKFAETGLHRATSVHVAAPSIAECPINVECRTYTRVSPPHRLLTPRHRERPVDQQHTIYFAEVLGCYAYTPA